MTWKIVANIFKFPSFTHSENVRIEVFLILSQHIFILNIEEIYLDFLSCKAQSFWYNSPSQKQ